MAISETYPGIDGLGVVIKAETEKIVHLDRRRLTDKLSNAGDVWYELAIPLARGLEISSNPKKNGTLRDFMAGLADHFIRLRDKRQLAEPAEDIRLFSTLFSGWQREEFLAEGAIALANADLIESAAKLITHNEEGQIYVAERHLATVMAAITAGQARRDEAAGPAE